ncbi:MAG: GNAT family N-acetyltransferase [Sphingomonadaceae bacterium]|nr:GNAT family N-acetyltransferase [Sphingomonadaceae bacterium]
MEIRSGGLDHPAVAALLRLHLDGMAQHSPAASVHALNLAGLAAPEVSFWAAWEGDELLGCAALKALGDGEAEIKSMRTAPGQLRRGVASALLAHLLGVARELGYRKIGLETGSGHAFAPAHALYRRFGFADCAAFGDYPADDPFSRFMSLTL